MRKSKYTFRADLEKLVEMKIAAKQKGMHLNDYLIMLFDNSKVQEVKKS
jgi:hypothetical protein